MAGVSISACVINSSNANESPSGLVPEGGGLFILACDAPVVLAHHFFIDSRIVVSNAQTILSGPVTDYPNWPIGMSDY